MPDSQHPVVPLGHPLRLLLVAAFIPAFPLCVAAGAAFDRVIPAVGIVPEAVSALLSGLLLYAARQSSHATHHAAADENASEQDDEEDTFDLAAVLTSPVAVFAFDTILAAALMTMLVFTWSRRDYTSTEGMLAAYATIPLLVSFVSHLYLALLALYKGLAIRDVVRYGAWRAVPADCPHCNNHLREPFPELPWLKRLQRRDQANDERRPLLVDSRADEYHDHEEEARPADHETAGTPQPEAVEVVRKKERKAKSGGSSAPRDEESTAGPWDS